jgi:hypothetical protein
MTHAANGQVRTDFPGHEIVAVGLRDLAAGDMTSAALVTAMAATRLRRTGLDVPVTAVTTPGHRLYDLLAADDDRAAHSRYNALIGRVVGYARAAEHATAR